MQEEEIKRGIGSSDLFSVSALFHTCRMRNSARLHMNNAKDNGLSSIADAQGFSLTDNYSQNINSKLL